MCAKRHFARPGVVAPQDKKAAVTLVFGHLQNAGAIGVIGHCRLKYEARSALVNLARPAGAVYQHPARALRLGRGHQRRRGAIRSDQRVGLVADQLPVERARLDRFRAVIEKAQLHAPAEQAARRIHLVLPQQKRFAVVGGKTGMRPGFRDHGADDEGRSLLALHCDCSKDQEK